ncbi:type VI secretion system-associated FHA domain protein TagH [Acidovorax sp. GBBC 3334]|uniref:type VI secretion system-associated FHA domain protein TagH n=1 Tax=Acidovorax sp. GBBC 3334 TaxID=2940496 RepID=UPI002303A3F8|nr:type VI secretion system-associated FHA domain protein TagH [Acidovorax sp. GBBC 3334]MDA8454126.1 type VI secretion system-associated FHA domain protein TagH [Acidovorax sp. GBBC 3334]
MDKVELRVIRDADGSVGRLWTAVFGVAGGTIGRGGQNKLVLPDGDAGVARVHAMVRMESEAAYIANLCERRSIFVAGAEVRSGEEVRLSLDDEVRIGPYTLRSVVPGAPLEVVPPSEQAVPTPVAVDAAAPPPDMALHQASWPVQESTSAALADPLAVGLPSDDSADNPFAMLGRVSSPGESAVAPSVPVEPVAELPAQNFPVQSTSALPPAEGPTPNKSVPASAPAAATSKQASHRALVIPEDFDLFAADARRNDEKKDVWTGGAQSKSLSEIANLRHDELLQSLPKDGEKFAHGMDNPAHAGLPKGLDPRNELDPMRLFGGTSGGSPSLMEDARASVALGSDLSQAFSMPRGVQEQQVEKPEVPEGSAAVAGGLLPAEIPALPGSSPTFEKSPLPTVPTSALGARAPAPAPAAAPLEGLQRVEGLDLGAFGSLSASSSPLDWPQEDAGADRSTISGPDSSKSAPVPQDIFSGMKLQSEPVVVSTQRSSAATKGAVVSQAVVPPTAQGVTSPAAIEQPSSVKTPEPTVSPLAPVLPDLESASPAELQLLITAFLEGAGVLPKKVEARKLSPEFMRSFGEAFRVAVQGTIDLLAARSEIKREFRAGVTIISSGANNPLKFLPTPEGVIMQMIGQNFPGFMKPIPAMEEAYDDLRVHQLALMAGLRAAYAEALARFDPVELEQRTDVTGGVLGMLSSAGRKAALWDEYKKSFAEIRRGAEDDLAAFSGQAFLEAYESAEAAAKAKK